MKPFKLDNENKINPGFKAPEGYFDNLPEKVMQQLPRQEIKVVPLYKRPLVWTSAVAAVFVIALGISIIWKSGNSADIQADDTINDTIVENYLSYQEDITQEDIIQGLTQQDINELEASIAINDDAIESYLSNEDYDIYLNE